MGIRTRDNTTLGRVCLDTCWGTLGRRQGHFAWSLIELKRIKRHPFQNKFSGPAKNRKIADLGVVSARWSSTFKSRTGKML